MSSVPDTSEYNISELKDHILWVQTDARVSAIGYRLGNVCLFMQDSSKDAIVAFGYRYELRVWHALQGIEAEGIRQANRVGDEGRGVHLEGLPDLCVVLQAPVV
jgi:hypothetical protein